MCGIVGYIGAKNAQEFVIDGLEKLEYRGYDSAGIAVNTGNEKFEIIYSYCLEKMLWDNTYVTKIYKKERFLI